MVISDIMYKMYLSFFRNFFNSKVNLPWLMKIMVIGLKLLFKFELSNGKPKPFC
jgi:hypothetical protein